MLATSSLSQPNPTRIRSAAALLALAAATAAPHAAADTGTLTLTNGAFSPTGWTTTFSGAGVVTGSQLASGGNPGTAWNVLNDIVGTGTIAGYHLWTGLGGTVDPAATGPISSIALALDGKYISGVGGNGMQISLTVEQDGIIYRTATQALGSTGSWVTRTFNAAASDFLRADGLAGTPDFSASGSPITLGFRTANNGTNYNVRAYYDNFLATITADAPAGPVVMKGNASPIAGTTFNYFQNTTSIGPAGHVAFVGELAGAGVTFGTRDVLCVGHAGSLDVMARKGHQAPGVPAGVTFSKIVVDDLPVVNASGQAFVFSELHGPGVSDANEAALFFYDGTSTTLVARQSEPAAGAEPGVTYGDFWNLPIHLNDAGQVAFANQLNGTSRREVIYFGEPGALSIVARTNDPVPGLGAGATIAGIDFQSLALNHAGQLAFGGTASIAGDAKSFLLAGTPGTMTVAAKEGQSISGATLGQFAGYAVPRLNAAGEIAFAAPLGPGLANTNDSAIFAGMPGALAVIAREGDPAPDTTPGTLFGESELTQNTTSMHYDSNGLALSESGAVVFRTSLSGPDVTNANESAIYSNVHGPLALVAREGDWAPGTPGDTSFAEFFDPFGSQVSNPMINAGGRIVFGASLTGPGVVAGMNDRGIWATNSTGQLGLVLRTGELFDVDPAPETQDLRVVQSFQLLSGGAGESGRATGINNLGQIVANIAFTGGSSGIFHVTDTRVPGDVNGDTVTDVLDFLDFINSFGECANQPAPCGTPDADINGDTVVDVLDFLDFLDIFGLMTE
jgi:hypothetical protein